MKISSYCIKRARESERGEKQRQQEEMKILTIMQEQRGSKELLSLSLSTFLSCSIHLSIYLMPIIVNRVIKKGKHFNTDISKGKSIIYEPCDT
jgi:hypothetical protein